MRFVWLGAAGALALYALPAALQVQLGFRALTWTGLGFAAGSGALHAAYFTTLQRGYRECDLSVVYPLAYILVLVALTLAPVSLVAPGREASIVIAALLGARVLGEGEAGRRTGAALVILAGVACLAAG
ncbi:MAG: hypothetical protein ACXVFK_06075 [Solirubrobacteraceae bacterium]